MTSKASIEDYISLGLLTKAREMAVKEGVDFEKLLEEKRRFKNGKIRLAVQPKAEPPTPKPVEQPAPQSELRPQPVTPEKRTEPPPAARKYVAEEFDNPCELLIFVYPHLKPYVWQAEELMRTAGYINIQNKDLTTHWQPTSAEPMLLNYAAVNGSGKDAIFVCAFSVWFILSKIRSRVICASASHEQLKEQTFKYMYEFCDAYNDKVGRKALTYTHFNIECESTGSQIKGRATDDPGKAEGFHPFTDVPNAEMAIVIGEAKSIDDDMFVAFTRWTGYNYWIEISSPGLQSGHFYKRCVNAVAYPEPLDKSRVFFREITAFQCPNISDAHINQVRIEHGEDSLIYQTSILCKFFAALEGSYIPLPFVNYAPPSPNNYGLSLKAGIDPALGGDEATIQAWLGNTRIAQSCVRFKHGPKVVKWIFDFLNDYKIKDEDAVMDIGGLGRPLWHQLKDMGKMIRGFDGGAKANNPELYANRIAEAWAKVRRLLQKEIINLPDDPKLKRQLTSRGCDVIGTKIRLQPKEELPESPDRADAMAMCFWLTPLQTFLNYTPNETIAKVTDLETRMKRGQLNPTEIYAIQQQYKAFRQEDPMRIGSMYARFNQPQVEGGFTIYGSTN